VFFALHCAAACACVASLSLSCVCVRRLLCSPSHRTKRDGSRRGIASPSVRAPHTDTVLSLLIALLIVIAVILNALSIHRGVAVCSTNVSRQLRRTSDHRPSPRCSR